MGLKTKLAMALVTSAAGAAMVAGGTFAEFSSPGATQNNTFSAGTLKLGLNPNNAGWGSGNVGATWVSPSNWAPGQTYSATLQLTDTGTIGAKHVFFSFDGIKDSNPSLLSEINITGVTEHFGTTSVPSDPAVLAQEIGKPAGSSLTLADFVTHQWYTAPGSLNNGYVIQAGDQKDYSLTLTFTFDDNADNSYQGTSASFNMNLNATQNTPTDGSLNLNPTAQ